ncbi:MAG: ATP-binding cassette domain-containing protein [Patescibacteria group bacterium]
MAKAESIVSFEAVSFEYSPNQPILESVDFSVRRGSKVTCMGQNGAGKSTIFQLITGHLTPESGKIIVLSGLTIALGRQVMPRGALDLTVQEFFQTSFPKTVYDLEPRIDKVLEIVHLPSHEPIYNRRIRSFSGGQQARLLLAAALIQTPDLLLLDEPTNNLDQAGIQHLTDFLINYQKTVLVISHDAAFLNAFSDGVLYLDARTHKIEQYSGNYHDVVKDISARIEKENRQNAQLAKEIQANKDKANFFAHKGGKMRLVAKRMRVKAEALEEEKVEVRQEDKTIRPFIIPAQPALGALGDIVKISSLTVIGERHQPVTRQVALALRHREHLLLRGPNGSGKTTLLEATAGRLAKGLEIHPAVKIGYYRQDFSTLDFDQTVLASLLAAAEGRDEESIRSLAAGFLLSGEIMRTPIGRLSEGQKGLVAFARLVLERPGLLILDEPTNHINFRHLPVIAQALNQYDGAMILVSHLPDFVAQIRIDEILDLAKFK